MDISMKISRVLFTVAGFLPIFATAQAKEIYLACSLSDASNQTYEYSFAFDPKKETFFWVEGTQNLKVIRNTSSQLWALHTSRFRDFPHDQPYFYLNRVSGAAKISYVRKPYPEEAAKCKKEQNWGCDSFFVLAERDEIGRCKLTERTIN